MCIWRRVKPAGEVISLPQPASVANTLARARLAHITISCMQEGLSADLASLSQLPPSVCLSAFLRHRIAVFSVVPLYLQSESRKLRKILHFSTKRDHHITVPVFVFRVVPTLWLPSQSRKSTSITLIPFNRPCIASRDEPR